jgi:hypothetical protein
VTAVLAAAARAALWAAIGVVLLLAAVGAMLWQWAGSQGWPLVPWLVAVCAVVVAAGLCASALQPKDEGGNR